MSFLLLYFLIYWLDILIKNKEEIQKLPKIENLQGVSIIIPCYNEEKLLKKAVLSCISEDYPKELLEVIIVDDGSTDNSLKIAKSLENEQIKVFSKKRGGKSSALNFGIKKAKFGLIATMDADSYYSSESSLKNMVPYFADKKIAAVTPAMKVSEPKNILQKLQAVEYISSIFFAKLFSFLNCIYVTPGPGSLYRKSAIEQVGLYDEHCIAEDMEIAFKLQKNNFKIVNSISSEVKTDTPDNFKKLFKQRLRWNTGFLENSLIHFNLFKQKRTLTHFVLPYNFFYLFSSFIFVYLVVLKPLYNILKEIPKWASINFDFVLKFPPLEEIPRSLIFGIKSIDIFFSINFLFSLLFIALAFYFTKELKSKKQTIFYAFAFVFAYPFILSLCNIGAIFYFVKYLFKKDIFETWS